MACDWRRCGGLNLGNDRLKWRTFAGFLQAMRIKLSYEPTLWTTQSADHSGLPGQGAQNAHRLAPIDVRQPHVHDHQVDLSGLGGLHALAAVLHRDCSNSSRSESCSVRA